jgi:membrane protein DedA with SNARE-associated domain
MCVTIPSSFFPLAFSLSESIKNMADWAIVHGGLMGAAGMMALESMIAPVPSEVVMPPLGFAVARGEFGWSEAIIATSLGSLIGSLISYYLGYFGGKPLVMKIGKYLLLNEEHLDLTSHWFQKHGGLTVFICRFIPVVRHFISIPAGIARMNLLKFCAYTLIGATIWNSCLLWVGFKFQKQLQEHPELIEHYRKPVDIVIVVIGVVVVGIWVGKQLQRRKAAESKADKAVDRLT